MTRRTPKRRWKQWTETEARAALDEWRASGLSAHAFARQRGVSSKRLAYWRRPLTTEPIAFVPVVAPSRVEARIEIERAGVVVRVREAIAPELLATIVGALARVEASC